MNTDQYESHHRKRSRSRSPFHHGKDDVKRHRSRSSERRHTQHHDSKDRKRHRSHYHHRKTPARLPFDREPLCKDDFTMYTPLFAEYLDIQKHLKMEELSGREISGRWKSFMHKWNEGDLGEGWYDVEFARRVAERWRTRESRVEVRMEDDKDEDEDGEYGPTLPSKEVGAAVPSLNDLQHRRELAEEDMAAQRADLRYERKLDRNMQKERLEELIPRADAGSRERQLEKKRDATVVNREFKDAKDGGDVEVGEGELMGGGEDEFKVRVKAQEKARNEREVKKEEVLRARAAEREERLRGVREKEEKTMEMLRGIARERFG